MHQGPIPSFYVANLESQSFSQISWAPRGPRVGPVKKLHETKISCFEVTYNFAVLHPAQIFLTFYLATCDPRAFPRLFGGPWGPGVSQFKRLHKTKTSCFGVLYNFSFMHQGRILTFCFVNLWSKGFSGFRCCIKPKHPILGSPTTKLSCTKAKFPL